MPGALPQRAALNGFAQAVDNSLSGFGFQLLIPGFRQRHIFTVGHIAALTRLQHQVAHPVAALRLVLTQNPADIAALAKQLPQHHRILQRRAAPLADIRGGAVSGIAQ